MATAPIPIAASELVMMPLMHFDRSPPVMGPTLMGPCPPTLGRDSHLEYPSGPRVSTQQRTSGSWLCIHNREKKPNPTIAVINSPATGGRCHSRRRAPRDSQTSDSGEPNNVCRRQKDEKAIDEKVEKLPTNDSRPTPRSSPPRTPGSRTPEATSASTYGESRSRAHATYPAR